MAAVAHPVVRPRKQLSMVTLALVAFASITLAAVAPQCPTAARPVCAEELGYPLAVATGQSGPIYLADRNLPGIWKVDGDKLSLYFQASKKFRTPLNAVRCVTLDRQGKLLAGDSATRDVYRFDDQGQPVALTKGQIGIPMSIVVTQAGELIVADLELHLLWRVPAEGGKPEKLAAVPAPRGLAIDAQDRIWVVSHGADQLLRVTLDGKVETVVKGTPFQFAHQIALDDDGNAYITDGYAKAVWKVSPGAEPQPLVKDAPLVNPVGIVRREQGFLVVDPRAKALFQLDSAGKLGPLPLQPAP
jgi:sugar lactone lactonase YvrE